MIEVDGVWHDPEIINTSGYWYRTQYLVLSRTLCEAMPFDWQERLVGLIEEIHDEFDIMADEWVTPKYDIKAKDDNGRFMDDPWGKYRYPNSDYIEGLRRNPDKTKQRNIDYIKSTASEQRIDKGKNDVTES